LKGASKSVIACTLPPIFAVSSNPLKKEVDYTMAKRKAKKKSRGKAKRRGGKKFGDAGPRQGGN
jgi:hypothetical protein